MVNDAGGWSQNAAAPGPAEVGVEVEKRYLDAEGHGMGAPEAQTAQVLFEWPPLELIQPVQPVPSA